MIAIDREFAGISALGAELAPLVGGSLLFREADPATALVLEQNVFTLAYKELRVQADLGAEKALAAEKAGCKSAVDRKLPG